MIGEVLDSPLPAHGTRHRQCGRVELWVDLGQLFQGQAGRSLDAHHLDLQQPRLTQLGRQLGTGVEMSARESSAGGRDSTPDQVFPPARQVGPDGDRRESGQSWNRGSEDPPFGSHHPDRLTQHPQPVLTLGQVVERTEEQRHIQTAVLPGEPARIADQGLEAAELPSSIDLLDDRVQKRDLVPSSRERRSMDPGRAADICDPRSRRDPLGNELLRPRASSSTETLGG